MPAKSSVAEDYRKFYVEMGLERLEVFEAVRDAYRPRTVLYPGSFIHIAASFYFQHVIYVDSSLEAARFFADPSGVQAFLQRKKTYKPPPYFRFLHHDFHHPLPLLERPQAQVGPQPERLGADGAYPGARLWVLPNPSGLNAHYSLSELAALYRQLKDAA